MRTIVLALCCVSLLSACGNDDTESEPEPKPSKPDAGSERPENLREVTCTDESVQQLMLFEQPATGKIRAETSDQPGLHHVIDATGGGLSASQSYVYARFTDEGLEKVDLNDEEAFESLDWDVAFRRYVVRLNSGVSGPGSVTAARTKPMTAFDSLTEAPDGLEFRTEEYFTEDCEYVPDGSGIGAPATALASYWTYSSCVQMTKNVYVIALPEDQKIKFEVLAYYPPENQKKCDETGQVPMPSGGGNFRIRWDFLE